MPDMQQVPSLLADLPEDLVFAPGSRMHSPKWKWVPVSFLGQPEYEFELKSTTGVLVVEVPNYRRPPLPSPRYTSGSIDDTFHSNNSFKKRSSV
jgi:hypothetical protein